MSYAYMYRLNMEKGPMPENVPTFFPEIFSPKKALLGKVAQIFFAKFLGPKSSPSGGGPEPEKRDMPDQNDNEKTVTITREAKPHDRNAGLFYDIKGNCKNCGERSWGRVPYGMLWEDFKERRCINCGCETMRWHDPKVRD